MKLVTLAGPPAARPGLLLDDEVLDLAAGRELGLAPANWPGASVIELLQSGDEALALARRLADRVAAGAESQRARLREQGLLRPRGQTRLLAPVLRPRLIISAGNNYASHSREMGSEPPTGPTGFIKSTSCVTGPDAPIVLPPEAPNMVDYEGEFCVVIGKPAYRVPESEALHYVAGYTCGNDVSARDWVPPFFEYLRDPLAKEYEVFSDPGTLNIRFKQFPTFMPLGPALVTADEVPDPGALQLRTLVNDQVRQDMTTGDLVFGVPALIAYWSRIFAFEPGDVITTGSPPGVGIARKPPVFLKAGDVVAVEIERLGRLVNPVVDYASQ